MPTLHMMMGLPLSGKTTWIRKYMSGSIDLVSADNIKEDHPDYDCEHAHLLHQYSVEKAEERFNELISYGIDVIFDGGGINNSYNKRLIKRAKTKDYTINLIIVDTPPEVCLERNEKRERKVPREAIIEKSVRFAKCRAELSLLIDEVVNVNYFSNDHIFVDMDGTIAAYQHIPLDQYGCIDFMNGEYFKWAQPVDIMIDKLRDLRKIGKEIYILSASPDSICTQHKNDWLDDNCPFIPSRNRFFIGNKKYKAVMLRNIMKKMKLAASDVTVVDDDHSVLSSLSEIGVNDLHTSKFLCSF